MITGFSACKQKGRMTTGGPNAEDYTTTLVCAMLFADRVVIRTATTGVMTTDVDIVDRSVALSYMTHYEAL